MPQLSSGNIAPDFDLADTEGRRFRLRDQLRAGPVALVFYKSACPTCQLTLPFVQKIEEAARQMPSVKIFGISQDNLEESVGFAKHFGLDFTILIDDEPYPVDRKSTRLNSSHT